MGESLELQAQDFPGGFPGLAYVVLLQPNGRAWGSAVKKGNLIYVYQSGGEGILGQQVKVSLAPGVPSIPPLGHVDHALRHPRGHKRSTSGFVFPMNKPLFHTGHLNTLL